MFLLSSYYVVIIILIMMIQGQGPRPLPKKGAGLVRALDPRLFWVMALALALDHHDQDDDDYVVTT